MGGLCGNEVRGEGGGWMVEVCGLGEKERVVTEGRLGEVEVGRGDVCWEGRREGDWWGRLCTVAGRMV